MTFIEAIRTVWSKYATFSGRAARPEYWWWVLFVILLNIATGIADGAIIAPTLKLEPFGGSTVQPLSMITGLVTFLPGLSVSVRRLHDIDRSGWWLLIAFIPLIGILVLLYWMVISGTDGANRFGKTHSAVNPDAHY